MWQCSVLWYCQCLYECGSNLLCDTVSACTNVAVLCFVIIWVPVQLWHFSVVWYCECLYQCGSALLSDSVSVCTNVEVFMWRNALVLNAVTLFVMPFVQAQNALLFTHWRKRCFIVWEETFTGKYAVRPNKTHMGTYKIYREFECTGYDSQKKKALCRGLNYRASWDCFIILCRYIELRTFHLYWQRNISYLHVEQQGWVTW